MSKKRTGLEGLSFKKIDPYGRKGGEQIQLLSLVKLRPDPDQPRRLLPADLARAVTSGEMAPAEVLATWLARVEIPDAEPALARPIQELQRLADSIALHGLINPITVRAADETAPAGVDYFIITGERRYWAHLLLHLKERVIQEGEEAQPAERIKAIIAPEGVTVRAHQMIENLMREDMNAVEKARGLWALRYELSDVTYRLHGEAEDEMDVTYRLHDGEEGEDVTYRLHEEPPSLLVPWKQVEEMMGISRQHRTRMTSILNLSPEAQQIIAEHDLAEMTIRPILQKLRDRPDLQVEALRQVILWQKENADDDSPGRRMVASVRELVEQLLTREARGNVRKVVSEAAAEVGRPVNTRTFRRRVQGTLRFLTRLDNVERDKLVRRLVETKEREKTESALRELRDQINTLLSAMQDQEEKE